MLTVAVARYFPNDNAVSYVTNPAFGCYILINFFFFFYFRGFVDDVMFAHNRPGKGDASGVYTQSDLLEAALGRSLMSTTALL